MGLLPWLQLFPNLLFVFVDSWLSLWLGDLEALGTLRELLEYWMMTLVYAVEVLLLLILLVLLLMLDWLLEIDGLLPCDRHESLEFVVVLDLRLLPVRWDSVDLAAGTYLVIVCGILALTLAGIIVEEASIAILNGEGYLTLVWHGLIEVRVYVLR